MCVTCRLKVMTAHIFLLGFMGSGKTYLGERLAERLGWPFFDLDRLLEAGEGKTITTIFAEKGEAAFRDLEREYLHTLGNQAPAVVATGGGTPCFFDNMNWMKAHGMTIYLKAPVEMLYERLHRERAGRPLLAGLSDGELRDFIEKKLGEREEWYRRAEMVMTSSSGAELVKFFGGVR